MNNKKKIQRAFAPRGTKARRALYLIGLLGFATVRQLCLLVWGNERSTNDALNRLVKNYFLHEAFEQTDQGSGRPNRIVFLTREGFNWILKQGHLGSDDIAFYWKGKGSWHPQYNDHNVLIHDVLAAFIKQASELTEHDIDIRLDPQTFYEVNSQEAFAASPLQTKALLPDRVFAVQYDDKIWECYLEVDCGTEDKIQWQHKLQKYIASPEVIEQDGVLVLIVAHTLKRMETLRRWSEDFPDQRFLFSCIQQICYMYERGNKDLEIVRSGNPFGSVWAIAGSDSFIRPLF